MPQPSEDLDVLICLDFYDWRTSHVVQEFDSQKQTILDDISRLAAANTAFSIIGISRLTKVGEHLLHQRDRSDTNRQQADADIAAAVRILNLAYQQTIGNPVLQQGLGEEYYYLVNHLAYAETFPKRTGLQDYRRIFSLLDVTFQDSTNDETRSFAQRIRGQTKFTQAQSESDFVIKRQLVAQGAAACLSGVASLDPENDPGHLTETARTYNRNASEWLDLCGLAPDAEKAALLNKANDAATQAQKFWDMTAPEAYPAFKGATSLTIQKIHAMANSLSVKLVPVRSNPKRGIQDGASDPQSPR
jgi:hypothetical protein